MQEKEFLPLWVGLLISCLYSADDMRLKSSCPYIQQNLKLRKKFQVCADFDLPNGRDR